MLKEDITVGIEKWGRFSYYVEVNNGCSYMYDIAMTLWGAKRAAKRMVKEYLKGYEEPEIVCKKTIHVGGKNDDKQ